MMSWILNNARTRYLAPNNCRLRPAFFEESVLTPPLATNLDLHALKDTALDPLIPYLVACECTVCAGELEGPKGLPHLVELRGWQWYHVRD